MFKNCLLFTNIYHPLTHIVPDDLSDDEKISHLIARKSPNGLFLQVPRLNDLNFLFILELRFPQFYPDFLQMSCLIFTKTKYSQYNFWYMPACLWITYLTTVIVGPYAWENMQNIFLGSIPNIEELDHPSFFHYKSDIFCRLSFFSFQMQSINLLSFSFRD